MDSWREQFNTQKTFWLAQTIFITGKCNVFNVSVVLCLCLLCCKYIVYNVLCVNGHGLKFVQICLLSILKEENRMWGEEYMYKIIVFIPEKDQYQDLQDY